MEGVWRDVAWCIEWNSSGIYLQLVRNSKENRTSVGIFRFETEKPKSFRYEEFNRRHTPPHTHTHTQTVSMIEGDFCVVRFVNNVMLDRSHPVVFCDNMVNLLRQ